MAVERKTAAKSPAAESQVAPYEQARAWLSALFVALVVARPLLPSEGAAWMGDDLAFDMLAICLAIGCLVIGAASGKLARPFSLGDAALAALTVACVISAV